MKVTVSGYYRNPQRNWVRKFDSLDEARAEAARHDEITVYIETDDGRAWKHGPNEPLEKI